MVDFESCSNFANFDWGKRGKKKFEKWDTFERWDRAG